MRPLQFVPFLLLLAVPAAAQSPLIATVPPLPPVFGAKTIFPAMLACTDQPTAERPSSPLHVLAPHGPDLQLSSARHGIVVLDGGVPEGLMVGQRYFTRRLLPPASGSRISSAEPGSIRTTGWLTVIAADEHSALARIDYACLAVEAGDYLDPFVEAALPERVMVEGRPDFSDLARVIFGVDRRETFGGGDVLSIDRGSAHGLALGTRVAFYRDRRNGTPLIETGAGIVVELASTSAKVVIDRARADVNRGDYVARLGSR